jgi:Phenazine biosynthesis-like protein
MKYRYYTCDVFTETPFGGNPLAVLRSAVGLSDLQMQQIAREFNYGSHFCLPTGGRSHAESPNLHTRAGAAVCRPPLKKKLNWCLSPFSRRRPGSNRAN